VEGEARERRSWPARELREQGGGEGELTFRREEEGRRGRTCKRLPTVNRKLE